MNLKTAPITKKPKKVANLPTPTEDPMTLAMREYYSAMTADVERTATEEGISKECAMDIQLLKHKGRWTLGLEKRLIQLHNAGTPPNMGEFGTAVNCKFV